MTIISRGNATRPVYELFAHPLCAFCMRVELMFADKSINFLCMQKFLQLCLRLAAHLLLRNDYD